MDNLTNNTSDIYFPGGSVVKNMPANPGDADLIPGSGRSPGGGNGNPLQHSCLENPMDRGYSRGAAKNRTQMKQLSTDELFRHTYLTHSA